MWIKRIILQFLIFHAWQSCFINKWIRQEFFWRLDDLVLRTFLCRWQFLKEVCQAQSVLLIWVSFIFIEILNACSRDLCLHLKATKENENKFKKNLRTSRSWTNSIQFACQSSRNPPKNIHETGETSFKRSLEKFAQKTVELQLIWISVAMKLRFVEDCKVFVNVHRT